MSFLVEDNHGNSKQAEMGGPNPVSHLTEIQNCFKMCILNQ